MKGIFRGFLVIVAFVAMITFILPAMGLYQIQFWGVKYADANRQVFEHSKSYVHGNVRDIENLKLEYSRAKTPEEKAAILDVLHHRTVDINRDELPADLREFVGQAYN